MKLAVKKEMKRKSLKKELRDAKFRFWQAEEKFERILLRWCRVSIRNKKWPLVTRNKDIIKHEMVACQQEVKVAQIMWDRHLRMQSKSKKKGRRRGKSK